METNFTKRLGRILSHRIALNLYFWIGFIFIPYLMAMGNEGHSEDHYHHNFRAQVLFALFYSIIIYFNNLYLLPRFFQTRKYTLYFIIIISFIALWAIFQAKYDYLFYGCNCLLPLTGNRFAIAGFQVSSFVIAFSAFKLTRDYVKKEDQFLEMEKFHLEDELKFLKGQINPHFLFNTLNSLYAFALEKSSRVPDYILKLSQILRYMLYECNEKFVPLEKELNYLKNYVDLQKIRMENRGQIKFQTQGDVNGYSIAPFLLINFVENCFKHSMEGDLKEIFVRIKVKMEDDELYFLTENNTNEYQDGPNDKQGIGLINSRKRLEILYPKHHSLEIDEGGRVFKTELKLKLDKYEV